MVLGSMFLQPGERYDWDLDYETWLAGDSIVEGSIVFTVFDDPATNLVISHEFEAPGRIKLWLEIDNAVVGTGLYKIEVTFVTTLTRQVEDELYVAMGEI